MNIPTITPRQLGEICEKGNIDLLDVRTPVEYREVHAVPARNVPLDRLEPAKLMEAHNASTNEPLYIICRSGSRAKKACEKFLAAGFPNVVNVEGGTLAWLQCGLPIVRGKKTISLERQVRIAAGTLVLIGTILGWLVHPVLSALAAFVGAGLVFAGVTDTCGMGMLLARMPWNRTQDVAISCCLPTEVRP
jgi:rhodanese-related sulfurtransferase